MKPYLLFLGLLLGSRSGMSQPSSAAVLWPPRRWTAGVQLAAYPRIALSGQPNGAGAPGYVSPWPLMLTLQYRAALRLAVEAGVLLRISPAATTTETTSGGTYSTTRQATAWAVPLVLRGQVAPALSQRWQLDAEFGLMPLSTRYTETTTYTPGQTGQNTLLGKSEQGYSDVPVVVGLGGTYALTPRLNLTGDARLTWSYLLTIVGQALTRRNDFVAPVTPALSAGLSYQFGPTRPRR
jgi:hypothetical protein